jgi:hypothetical protein
MNKEMLKSLARMAARAYWKDGNGDCGCNYNEESCPDCKHDFFCKNSDIFYNLIDVEEIEVTQ